MKVGLVGFSGAGKTTAFRWLTGVIPDPSKIQQGQVGMAPVPDERLDKMILKFKPKKQKYAEIAFLDTPGLMLDERKDNPRRLAILREATGLLIVLDGFSGLDLATQLIKFRDELVFADLELVLNRIDRVIHNMRKTKPAKEKEIDEAELAVLRKLQETFEQNKPATVLGMKEEEEKYIRSFQLLTLKPEMVFVNLGESLIGKPLPDSLLALAPSAIGAPAKLEMELEELDDESRQMFMADLGLTESQRKSVIQAVFTGMGRIVFFTVGEDECRSWPLTVGTSAVDGAGSIHTDLAKGFVRAEVIGYSDFVNVNYSEKDAKANGTFRLESKDYIVKDGDVMHIRANK